MNVTPIDIDWHPRLSIYASKEFLKTVGDEYGWIGGTDSSGNLRCVLPYTIVRKATLRMVRFRVETIPLGDGITIQEERSFLNGTVDYFRSIGADVIIPSSTNAIFRTYPDDAMAAPYGTYIIDLQQPEEALWKNVHSKHRNVIRNAEKKGVRILDGAEHTEATYSLIEETFKRSAMPFMSHKAFERMVRGLGENVKLFVADYHGAIQGCAVVPFSQQSAYYAYGGTIAEPLSGATNLLQWDAIRYFRSIGVKHYDFCGVRIKPEKGSKAAGLMMYKQRFGPQLLQGYLWKHALRPLKSAIYSWAVRVLRGGDIVDCEHHKLLEAGALVTTLL
jgi:hypothetical protein